MIVFILLQLRVLTVWKRNTISHRWPIICQFTCLLFWLLNLIPIKHKKLSQMSKLLVPDWNHLENIHIVKSFIPSSSIIFQRWSDISSIKYSCWAWWEAMTPLGLFSGCWMLKIGNPLTAMLLALLNYGQPSLHDCGPQQRLFKGLFIPNSTQWNTSLFIDGQVEVKKRTQAFLWAAISDEDKNV